jgi:hypothetical protein
LPEPTSLSVENRWRFNGPPEVLTIRRALRPLRKVYTILIGYIKKNRIIFETNFPKIWGKLTINPVYIQKDEM